MDTLKPSEQALTPAPRGRHLVTLLLVACVAAAALGAGVYFGRSQQASTARPVASGAAVYGVTLPDLDGKPVSLAQFKGKPLVVNFWATWCGPCREEMPAFVEMQRTDANRVQFVGIGVDDADKLKAFATSLSLNYPSLVGGYGALELSRSFGNSVMALPFTLVLDANGTVVHTQLGPLPPAQLRSILAQMG